MDTMSVDDIMEEIYNLNMGDLYDLQKRLSAWVHDREAAQLEDDGEDDDFDTEEIV